MEIQKISSRRWSSSDYVELSHCRGPQNNVQTFLRTYTEIVLLMKPFAKARFIRRISAVSNSIQRITFDRNSTSESAASFLQHVRLTL